MKLANDDTLQWQYYSIMLSGAVELAANDGQPTPAQPAPDLVVTEIIFEQSPAKIRVRVMNSGSGPSTSCFLALASGAADDPSLGTKKRVWSIPVPALEAGKGFSSVIDAIGNTPLIRLRRASDTTGCEILGKAEFLIAVHHRYR